MNPKPVVKNSSMKKSVGSRMKNSSMKHPDMAGQQENMLGYLGQISLFGSNQI